MHFSTKNAFTYLSLILLSLSISGNRLLQYLFDDMSSNIGLILVFFAIMISLTKGITKADIVNLFKNKISIILLLIVALYLFNKPDFISEYYIYKNKKLLLNLFTILFGMYFVIRDEINLKQFVYVEIIVILLSTLTPYEHDSVRSVFGAPISVSRYVGFVILLTIIYRDDINRIVNAVILLISTYVLITTSTRAVLLSLCLIVPLEFLLDINKYSLKKKMNYIMLVLGIGGIFIIYSFYNLVNQESIKRITQVLNISLYDIETIQAMERFNMLKLAVEQWKQNILLGGGTASYPIYLGFDYKAAYAHNIFFEFLGEQGLVGFLLISILCVEAIKSSWRKRCHFLCEKTFKTIFLTLLFGLLTAQFSLDFPKQTILFIGLGMVLAASRWTRFYRVPTRMNTIGGHMRVVREPGF